MSAEPIEIDDVEDALRRADEYAELTGRSKADVIADLLDDGQLNRSAGTDIEPDKDFLDVAQEKAEKLKTLLITLAPMIALLSGVGLEGLGVLDFTDWGEDSMWEDDPNYQPDIYWGCTSWDAENYDPAATDDDGSCSYSNDPPKIWGCTDPGADNYEPEANEDDDSCDYPPDRKLEIQNAQLSLVGDDELKVEFDLFVQGGFCCDDIEIAWEIEVNGFYDDGLRRVTLHSYDEEGYFGLEQYWPDMGEGNYHARLDIQWQNNLWDEETTNGVTIEAPPVQGCTDSEADNYNAEAEEDDGSCEYTEYEDEWADIFNFTAEKDGDDAIKLTIQVDFNDDAEWNDDLRLRWTLWRDGETSPTEDEETYMDVRDANNEYQEFRFDGVGSGTWITKVQAYFHEDLLDDETFEEEITIGEVECVAEFYTFQLYWTNSNNNSLTTYSDPDETNECGQEITVDIYFELTWASNGTVVYANLTQLNTTGEAWDDVYFYGPNLTNGTYQATLELYLVVDGERVAEVSEMKWWNEIICTYEEES